MNKDKSVKLVANDGSVVDAQKAFDDWENLILGNIEAIMQFEEDLNYHAEDGYIVMTGKDADGNAVEPVSLPASDYPYVYDSLNDEVMMHLDG